MLTTLSTPTRTRCPHSSECQSCGDATARRAARAAPPRCWSVPPRFLLGHLRPLPQHGPHGGLDGLHRHGKGRAFQGAGLHLLPQAEGQALLRQQSTANECRLATTLGQGLKVARQVCPAQLAALPLQPVVGTPAIRAHNSATRDEGLSQQRLDTLGTARRPSQRSSPAVTTAPTAHAMAAIFGHDGHHAGQLAHLAAHRLLIMAQQQSAAVPTTLRLEFDDMTDLGQWLEPTTVPRMPHLGSRLAPRSGLGGARFDVGSVRRGRLAGVAQILVKALLQGRMRPSRVATWATKPRKAVRTASGVVAQSAGAIPTGGDVSEFCEVAFIAQALFSGGRLRTCHQLAVECIGCIGLAPALPTVRLPQGFLDAFHGFLQAGFRIGHRDAEITLARFAVAASGRHHDRRFFQQVGGEVGGTAIEAIGHRRPDVKRRLRRLQIPAQPVERGDDHVQARFVNLRADLGAVIGEVAQRPGARELNRAQHAAVGVFLDQTQRRERGGVADRHTDAPAGHVEVLGERVELNCHVPGALCLEDRRRLVAVVGDLGVGRVVADQDVVATRELHGFVEESERGDGGGRVVGVVEPQDFGAPRHVRRHGGQIGQPVVLSAQRQNEAFAACHQGADVVDRIARLRHEGDIARINERPRDVRDAVLAADGGEDFGFGIERHAVALLIIRGDGFGIVGHREIAAVAMAVGVVRIAERAHGFINDRVRRGGIGVADTQRNHVDTLLALSANLPAQFGKQIRRNQFESFRGLHSVNSWPVIGILTSYLSQKLFVEFTFENRGGRAGHVNVVVAGPFDVQVAAWQVYEGVAILPG